MTVHDEHPAEGMGAAERQRQAAAQSQPVTRQEQRSQRSATGPARFLAFLRNGRYGYAEVDGGGILRDLNPRTSLILGCPAERAVGRRLVDFVHESEREAFGDGFRRALAPDDVTSLECRMGDPRTGFRNVSLIACRVGGEPSPPRVVFLLDDAADVCGTEAALRALEMQLRSVLDHVPDIVLIITPEGRVEHANRAFREPRCSQIVGTELLAHFAADDHAMIGEVLDAVRAAGQPQTCEVQDTDGRWWMSRVVALQDGEAAGRLMMICTDVTQRKEGEESLRKSEAELRCLFDNIPDFVILVDKDARIQFANRPAPGTTMQQLLGASGFTFMNPAYVPACRRALGLAFASGRTQELEMLDVFGTWWDCRLVPMPREGRSAGEVMIICANITARKQTELSLRKSEAHYRALFESTADAAFLFDDVKVVDCNAAAVSLAGYPSREALVGMSMLDMVPPRQLDGARSVAASARRMAELKERGSARFEFLAKRLDGAPLIVDLTMTAITIDKERLFLTLARDITERKQAEQALRESEHRFKALAENSPNLIFINDLEGRTRYVNRACETLLDYTREEVYSREFTFLQTLAPECLPLVAANWEAHRRGCAVEPAEYVLLSKTGRRVTAIVATKLMDYGGAPALLGIVTDISERKRGEQALRESEQRYRLITENSLDLIWVAWLEFPVRDAAESEEQIDRVLDSWRWAFISSSVQRVLEYTVEEALQLPMSRLLTPASYAVAREAAERTLFREVDTAISGMRPVNLELEHITKSGRPVWCDVAIRVTQEDGDRLRLEGVSRDVTQRKDIERTLASMIAQRQQEMAQRLHDELGQNLLGLRLMAEGLRKSVVARDAIDVQHVRELAQAAEQAQQCVAQIIKGVRPVEVAPSGLMAALADLAHHTQRLTGLPCIFQCDGDVPVDNSHTATELFYIAQEAVRNAVKHAAAQRISIALSVEDQQLTLTVADDGQGIGLEWDGASGMGLRIMKHRAAVINASLIVKAADPWGTLVVCTLPLGQRTRP